MRILALVTTTVLGLAGSIAATRPGYAVKDELYPPPSWTRVSPAPKDRVIDLQIGLKQNRYHELERHLLEVSDPDHPRWGQHLAFDEVKDLVAPTEGTLELVHRWLAEHGILRHHCTHSRARDWVFIKVPVATAEKLLDTIFSIYRHDNGQTLIRTSRWSLPISLSHLIDTVQPTNSFIRGRQKSAVVGKRSIEELNIADLAPRDGQTRPSDTSLEKACDPLRITPYCLRTLYGTSDYIPQMPGKNRMAINNLLGETSNRTDIHVFLKQLRPDAVLAASDFKFVVVNNGTTQQTHLNQTEVNRGIGMEGGLDASSIIGIAYPTPLTVFSTGGLAPSYIPDDEYPDTGNEPYLEWLQYVLALPDGSLPQVISTSYGDDEQTVPRSYAESVCRGFAQLGARGVSVFFASGDDGVGQPGFCFTNDGKHRRTFVPEFPASCPYVTTVGATKGVDPEVAAFKPPLADQPEGWTFASGGGFSNYFPRPTYQEAAVAGYLKKMMNEGQSAKGKGKDEYAGLYDPAGRAYPDLAANGQHYAAVYNGSWCTISGTSASAPTVAGIFSLVNDALLSKGRRPLGFVNPWLYKHGYRAFRDVTNGSARGCGTEGFVATEGWDPVTGFGTPTWTDEIRTFLGFLRFWACNGAPISSLKGIDEGLHLATETSNSLRIDGDLHLAPMNGTWFKWDIRCILRD